MNQYLMLGELIVFTIKNQIKFHYLHYHMIDFGLIVRIRSTTQFVLRLN